MRSFDAKGSSRKELQWASYGKPFFDSSFSGEGSAFEAVEHLFFFTFLLICFSTLLLAGCSTTSKSEEKALHSLRALSSDLVRKDKDRSLSLIGPGDELKVNVWRQESLNRSLVVSPDGWLSFPLVGDLQATGLTPIELRDKIKQGLGEYYYDPQVSVEVSASKSKRVYVLGEVKKPGVIGLTSSLSAIEAISYAGGFTADAKETSVLLVKSQKSKEYNVIPLNMKSALTKGVREENPLLDAGDLLYVPPSAIANLDRFVRRIAPIISTIVEAERGIVLWPLLEDVISDGGNETITIVR